MKNAMKKLLSLVLVAMLLVSAVPFQASAAVGNFTVDVTITNTDGETLATATRAQVAGDAYTAQQYLDSVYPGWSDSYSPIKFWIKNDETGSEGQRVDASHTITRTTRLVVKLEHNDVALYLKVYKDGSLIQTVPTSVAYGSTVVLNSSWVDKAGYSGLDADVTSGGIRMGESFTATEPREIQIYIKTAGNNGDDSGSNGGSATKQPITLQIKNGEGSSYPVEKTITETPSGDSAKVSDMLYHWYGNKSNDWQNSYTFTKAWSNAQQKDVGYEGSIAAGDTVTVVLTPKSTPTTPTKPTTPPTTNTTGNISLIVKVNDVTKVQKFVTKQSDTVNNLLKDNLSSDWASKYTFNGFKVEGEPYTYGNPDSTVYAGQTVTVSLSGGTSKYNTCKVRLHVFLNGKVSEEARTFDITSMASDTVISLKEVSNFLLNYYSATTSTGIKFDGLYKAEGAWLGKFVQDKRLDSIENVDDLLEAGHVDINIMLDNAKAKTSSTADSSNPKTGDAIFAPVAVLTLSTAALAAVYFISKKRVVR